ncbi:hypothetical protein P3339_17445 [Microbulbifer sp. MLAF003]|uniref:hypothetical protein n=2 Tax=unclassified Microbulbifer TaxID=2619833 RepID=UPI0024ACF9B2|nr:hypothetical protein [Microbulbifer sp. MLAF003]WHI50216.1 hypothetical protein P3339_17445 [Microbulbifer sp. MLAF003]
MVRFAPLLVLMLVIHGCERQSDSHRSPEPDTPASDGTVREAMKEPVAPPTPIGNTPAPPTEHSMNARDCTPEWFAWAQQQIISRQSAHIAKLYPSGLPPVGSKEWFTAVTILTGGSFPGIEPGSPEWCEQIQKRLTQGGSQGP